MRALPIPILEHMTEKRIERFRSRVMVRGRDDCWLWKGQRYPNGYGVMSIEPTGSGKTLNLLAHRIAKTLELGRDVSDLARHSCDNPPCCNPHHVLEGTPLDNVRDMIKRRRACWLREGGHPHLGKYGVDHPASDYDAGVRETAVKLWTHERWTMKAIAKEIGCHRETVHRWLWEAFPDAMSMPASVKRIRRGT